jgi:hypothetical protein
MKDAILEDAFQRDITTARRIVLLEILWNERYLTRAQLIAQVELRLGKKCFGVAAWQDTFFRDMCFVKQAFESVDYRLLYSRNRQQPGYYLDGQPALSVEIKQVLKGNAAEVDQRQIDIYRKLSFADRFHQGCSISDTTRKVVAYRIRQDNPKLSVVEANRMALQGAYSQRRINQGSVFEKLYTAGILHHVYVVPLGRQDLQPLLMMPGLMMWHNWI